MLTRPKTVAIVGGGFSGTVLAINLLRNPSTGPLRIRLIEQRAQVGRGVAYAETTYPYLLNVPASRMSVNPAIPSDFVDFARKRHPSIGADDFLPRSLYGEYLRDLLARAQIETTADFRIIQGTAYAVSGGGDQPFSLHLAGAPQCEADRVVLCIGAPPAAPVCQVDPSALARGYVDSAYGAPINFMGDDKILLLGTGLTMADIAVAADAQNSSIVIHALSRHGLLPKAQTAGPSIAVTLFDIGTLPDTSLTAIFRRSRAMADELAQRDGDWRDAVVALRGLASRLWVEWSERDRRRFLRHLRALWDIHRHRLPPQTTTHLQRLRDANRLHVHAGRIQRLSSDSGRIRVDWVSRSGAESRTNWFDRVVNCTGASSRLDDWNDPLAQSLRSQGLICADALGLGVRTGQHCVVLGASGAPTDNLYYLGPMLRADYWEATATAELRSHAESLAGHLLRRL